jgi:hypothetical protein
MLAEAACTLLETVSIAGHALRRAREILDKYLVGHEERRRCLDHRNDHNTIRLHGREML